MIIIHTDEGRITQAVFDPVPEKYDEMLISRGITNFIEQGGDAPPDMYTDFYVKSGHMVTRPDLDVEGTYTLKVGEKLKLKLPKGCTISLDGESHVLSDGVLDIEGEMPAEYDISIDAFPARDRTVKVIVK